MKNRILLTSVLLVFAACDKNSNPLSPVNNSHIYLNPYAGTYSGAFREKNTRVDSTGVTKSDTSYNTTVKLTDGGNYTFNISKGQLVINSVSVDSAGNFAFVDNNHHITGYFVGDSIYIFCNSLHGAYDSIYFTGSWFLIQRLSFQGKKAF